jgi:hypothetical protein
MDLLLVDHLDLMFRAGSLFPYVRWSAVGGAATIKAPCL